MKFAIFGNIYQAKKSSYAELLFKLLTQHNAQICICQEFYNFLTETLHLVLPPVELFNDDDFEADIVISLGGDGKFFHQLSYSMTMILKQISLSVLEATVPF